MAITKNVFTESAGYSKADLIEPRPENWDEVKHFEDEWIEEGSEGEPELPLLHDNNGRVTMSALENVGMESMKLEIVRRVKDSNIYDPLELPEGWYRSDLE